jgi:MYXO-CTERM domain-containing protein
MFYYAYDVPSQLVEAQDQVRAYSPQGPRIDGVPKPDVLAPDNPWVAMAHATSDPMTFPYGAVGVFGGTSGASPHVTGVAALLAQTGVRGDAAREAIRKGAATDAAMGTLPNGQYGWGRLDAAGALGVTAAGITPTLTVVARPAKPAARQHVSLVATATGGDGFEIKWDDDYDGTWDTPYDSLAPRVVTALLPGTRVFKARVRNSSGRVAEALVHVTFGPPETGCGCRLGASAPPTGPLVLLALLAALLVRRRARPAARAAGWWWRRGSRPWSRRRRAAGDCAATRER